MALKFTASNWNSYDSVRVGLDPSQGTGLVEILSDPDKNGVFKITDKDTQNFVVEARDEATVVRKTYDLSGLTLENPTPAENKILSIEGGTGTYKYYSNLPLGTDTTVVQTLTSVTDNCDFEESESYTGEIVGTLNSTNPVKTTKCLGVNITDDFEAYVTENTPPEGVGHGWVVSWACYDANNTELGSGQCPPSGMGYTQYRNFAIPVYQGTAELDLTIIPEYYDASYNLLSQYDVSYKASYMTGNLDATAPQSGGGQGTNVF